EKRKAVTHCPAQNSSDHITRPGIRWQLTIRYSERHGAHMVSHYAHGNVGLFGFFIGDARGPANVIEQGREYIRVVVGCFFLDSHAEAFEAHARVDMPRG